MLGNNASFSLYRNLSADEYPQLHNSVQALTERAGLAAPRLVIINRRLLGNDPASFMLRAAPVGTFVHGDRHHIFFNEEMMHLLGMPSLDAPIAEELKAVIAHELGHIKRGDTVGFGTAKMAAITPLSCLIAGLGVTAYLRHHAQRDGGESAGGNAERAEIKTIDSPTLKATKCIGEYLLGAIAGAGVGIGIATFLRHRMEYSCDAFSKMLMGTGEPLVRALENFEKYSAASLEALAEKGISPDNLEKLKRYSTIVERLLHPSVENRVAALR
jgi:Zn-dependent protease with chaperone function